MNAHWILHLKKPEGEEEFTNASYHCSNCFGVPIDAGNRRYPISEYYCHRCGAHMIEEPVVKVEIYSYDDNEFKWE